MLTVWGEGWLAGWGWLWQEGEGEQGRGRGAGVLLKGVLPELVYCRRVACCEGWLCMCARKRHWKYL